ncbi:MAG: hypothetical protein RLZZ01_2016 [Actinomycetota bacterium]
MTDSFPRQYAKTRRLTLGEPRNLTMSSDGDTVVFARSLSGSDPVNRLWALDLSTGIERLVADPFDLFVDDRPPDGADEPPEERARRERLREAAGGITGYSTDPACRTAAFASEGRLFVTDIGSGTTREIDVPGSVFDPRIAPDGRRIAYVSDRALWVTDLDGHASRIAGPDTDDAPTVSWGLAEFIAAEELQRTRGHWWSPDSTALAVCRVDDAHVPTWHISDPADPSSSPRSIRYPAAGTTNATVSLHVHRLDGSSPVRVGWDTDRFEYLVQVAWTTHGLAMTLLSRDQRRLEVRSVDPATGDSRVVFTDEDDHWVEVVPGTGRLVGADDVVMCSDREGARRLIRNGRPVTPPELQVRGVLSATSDDVVFVANPIEDPTVRHVHRWRTDGTIDRLTDGPAVHDAVVGGGTVITRRSTLTDAGSPWILPGGVVLTSHAERPLVEPMVDLVVGRHDEPTVAVLLPVGHDGGPLPVLMDPYGGPHAQRVVRSYQAFCASQWFADQGFAVVVADGRGTPGRGTAYERAVSGDLASGVLDDQVRALEIAARRHPFLDLDRVAIRGWSFGGYLAALAVLRRPDVFHAAIAGAPVTEWRLYDTAYTERYLGDPTAQPQVYDANSLIPAAAGLERPLLLIHGLADDNVVAAHTLRLSSALLAAGRPHEVLPLVGVTHMTPQEVVAENLLLHQVDFLKRYLGHLGD